VSQLPPTVRPNEGWGYEKADAPNEGLLRAIANRQARCDVTLAKRPRNRPAWCDDERFRGALEKLAQGLDNGGMEKTPADTVLENLLINAANAPNGSREEFFGALWKSNENMQRHVMRRMGEGSISGLDEYITRTFEVLGSAETMAVSLPFTSDLKASAKVEIAKDGWIVLLTPNGRIVSSYYFDSNLEQFEQKEQRTGHKLREYDIGTNYREIAKGLFLGR
jgi:hypothetical protein